MSVRKSSDSVVGSEFAGYLVEALIGRGGMGAVYRAEERGLGRKVALKVIASELAEDSRFRERFLRESRVAASLDHPHIVPIFQAGDEDGVLFLAMRYVDGTDLAQLISREGALEPARAVSLLEQVAEALDAAHEKGLVHRDVKPSNVLIAVAAGKEHCYLADFGLTKRTGSLSGVSAPGRRRRHARVRRARADHGRRRRRARGRLLARLRPLRVPDRAVAVPPGDRRRAPLGARARGAAAAERGPGRAAAGRRRGAGARPREGAGAAVRDGGGARRRGALLARPRRDHAGAGKQAPPVDLRRRRARSRDGGGTRVPAHARLRRRSRRRSRRTPSA